jgi:hypothetical protein
MSNQHHSARTAGRRIFRWLGSAERPASAAAANGEPAPLLTLEAWQRVRPSVEERPRHPEGGSRPVAWCGTRSDGIAGDRTVTRPCKPL